MTPKEKLDELLDNGGFRNDECDEEHREAVAKVAQNYAVWLLGQDVVIELLQDRIDLTEARLDNAVEKIAELEAERGGGVGGSKP